MMSQNSISTSLLNIMLVLAESAITIVLRVDSSLRKAVYPLAQKNTIVSIRSYLPHVQFYATFTTKGILLDSKLSSSPAEVDVVINAFSHQLINALVSNDPQQVQKLTMCGSTETVLAVRHFLVRLGFASLIQGIVKTIKGNADTAEQKKEKGKSQPDYKEKVEKQQLQINALSIRNRELEVALKEGQSKQKLTVIALVVISLIAIASIIGWAL